MKSTRKSKNHTRRCGYSEIEETVETNWSPEDKYEQVELEVKTAIEHLKQIKRKNDGDEILNTSNTS
jgi:hypothetical protein